ncbi:MAG: YigZ family protein [Ruminococcaceae bacterium]|nr:YigZ family protein [Oscillospiraceae bacterium]
MNSYITIKEPEIAELTEKKSRFIATLSPCTTEEEATAILAEIKSKYWDARHNVYAYILRSGTVRFSDDGEPHGTAGKPVLDVLAGSGLTDVIVVVTRYFGGILLGTGGLVRAYSGAAKLVTDNVQRVEMCPCVWCKIVCDYQNHQRLITLINDNGGTVTNEEFTDNVTVSFSFKEEDIDAFEANLCEVFSARLKNERVKNDFSAFFI